MRWTRPESLKTMARGHSLLLQRPLFENTQMYKSIKSTLLLTGIVALEAAIWTTTTQPELADASSVVLHYVASAMLLNYALRTDGIRRCAYISSVLPMLSISLGNEWLIAELASLVELREACSLSDGIGVRHLMVVTNFTAFVSGTSTFAFCKLFGSWMNAPLSTKSSQC